LGEDERFEVERLRCILLSQPGDLPLGFDDSSADKDSDEDPGDSRRLLKARSRSRIMVLATLDAVARLSEYSKSGARRSLMYRICLMVDTERKPKKSGQMICEAESSPQS
jgi:hypothetical protein